MNLFLELSWPPSANTYWRRNGGRYFISQKGQDYRRHVYFECRKFSGFFNLKDRIDVSILAYPPDKRIRDLDNLFKSTLDSLQYAKIFNDDNQIDKLSIERMPENLGKICITLSNI